MFISNCMLIIDIKTDLHVDPPNMHDIFAAHLHITFIILFASAISAFQLTVFFSHTQKKKISLFSLSAILTYFKGVKKQTKYFLNC